MRISKCCRLGFRVWLGLRAFERGADFRVLWVLNFEFWWFAFVGFGILGCCDLGCLGFVEA